MTSLEARFSRCLPVFIPLLLVLALSPGLARAQSGPGAAPEFDHLVQQVSLALHSRPRQRRLLGAAFLRVRGADPIGAKGTHLALFDLDGEPTLPIRHDVAAALQTSLAPPWQLVAHTTSKYGDRESWLYARPVDWRGAPRTGTRVETVACLLERGQATLVMAEADPQAVLNSLEDNGIIIWSHRAVVRGLWGGLGDGSGFGPGFAFETPAGGINLVQLHGSAQATYEGYFATTLGFRFDPTGGNLQTFSLDLTGRYNVSPNEDFFGLGPNSPGQRTMFNRQERGLALTFAVRPARTLDFGVGEDYSGTRVFAGHESGYANAQAVFASQAVPGLARGANLYGTFAYAQYDGRDHALAPHRGAYLRLSGSDNHGAGNSTFGYWNERMDARAYLPLTHYSDVLAGRLLGDWNQAKAGEAVPIFDLARLGDSSALRGYRPYRFYGLNAVTGSLEYRHYFDDDFGAFLFGDAGQVYDRRAELTRSNMRTTWGAGLLFNDGRRKTSFKLFFGTTSDEAHRWFLTFGPTF